LRHDAESDEGLAGAAREHQHAAAAAWAASCPERLDRRSLILAQRERRPVSRHIAHADGKWRPIGVARQILHGIPDAQQGLLQPAALQRLHERSLVGVNVVEERFEPWIAPQLLEEVRFCCLQDEMVALGEQSQASVPSHQVSNVGQDVRRQLVLGELDQRFHHVIDTQSGRAGVPERQRRDRVRVNVLGALA
jgi:hypothetical protein